MHDIINDVITEIILLLDISDVINLLAVNKNYRSLDVDDLWIKLIERDFSKEFNIEQNKTGYINYLKFLNDILPDKSFKFMENKAQLWNVQGLKIIHTLHESFDLHHLIKNLYFNGGSPVYGASAIYNSCRHSDKSRCIISYMNKTDIKNHSDFIINSCYITTDDELKNLCKLINTPELVWFRNSKGKICKTYATKTYSLAKDLYDQLCNHVDIPKYSHIWKLLQVIFTTGVHGRRECPYATYEHIIERQALYYS